MDAVEHLHRIVVDMLVPVHRCGASPFVNRHFQKNYLRTPFFQQTGMKMKIPVQYFLPVGELCMFVDDLCVTEDEPFVDGHSQLQTASAGNVLGCYCS